MQISRRHLLALSAGTAAVGALGASGLVIQWWDQPATAPYKCLSDGEATFVRAWAGVAFPATEPTPMSGDQARLDRFFDQMLQFAPPDATKLLKLLLNGLDAASVPTHGTNFVSLDEAGRLDRFEAWTHSDLSLLRSATQGLVLLIGMGWSTHPDVAPVMEKMHSCGFGR
jgi:hypothetical protein